MKQRAAGFTLVEVMIVVGIVGLIATLALPAFMKARALAQKNSCLESLVQIDGAKEQWALEAGKATGDPVVTNEIALYIKNGTLPTCPGGGTYSLNPIGSNVTCTVAGHVSP